MYLWLLWSFFSKGLQGALLESKLTLNFKSSTGFWISNYWTRPADKARKQLIAHECLLGKFEKLSSGFWRPRFVYRCSGSFALLLYHGLHDRAAIEPPAWVHVHALVHPDMQWSTLPWPAVYSQHVFMILVQFVYSCQIGFLLRACLGAQQYEMLFFLSCGQFFF